MYSCRWQVHAGAAGRGVKLLTDIVPATQSPLGRYFLTNFLDIASCFFRCVRGLQGTGVKVLADIVINHRCAANQDDNGVWNVFGGKLAWDADAVGSWSTT